MSSYDSYHTPHWLRTLFSGYYDPCPFDLEWQQNGLETEWKYQDVYVNPPYSNPSPWVDKAIETAEINNEFEPNNWRIVMLLRHDSSTKWFARLQEAGAKFLMIQGRLKFDGPHAIKSSKATSPFPSILAVL